MTEPKTTASLEELRKRIISDALDEATFMAFSGGLPKAYVERKNSFVHSGRAEPRKPLSGYYQEIS